MTAPHSVVPQNPRMRGARRAGMIVTAGLAGSRASISCLSVGEMASLPSRRRMTIRGMTIPGMTKPRQGQATTRPGMTCEDRSIEGPLQEAVDIGGFEIDRAKHAGMGGGKPGQRKQLR